MELVAVYGTLKKGFALHGSYLRDAEFVGPMTIKAVMHLRYGSYPVITHHEEFEDASDLMMEHEVEVYRIEDETFQRVRRMEEGAGYETEKVQTPYGVASMFWMPKEGITSDDRWIPAFLIEEFGE